jgi:outer membrane biosynthesis protein TonB
MLSGIISKDDFQKSALNESRQYLNEMEATVLLAPETPEELEAVDGLDLDLDMVEVEPTPEAQAAAPTAAPEEEALPPEEVDVAPEEEALPPEDVDVAPEEEALPPEEVDVAPEEEEVTAEARLRRTIRREVRTIVNEILNQREETQLAAARQTKSVATAMGYKETPRRPNRASARGPGGSRGFGGPGFM